MTDEMILNTSDEAATYRTGLSGWVDRHGRYFGKEEDMARWSGCTHVVCECGNAMSKGWTKCEACREKRDADKYAAAERKPWDGESVLYADAIDTYFYNFDEIDDHCAEHGCSPESLRLYICDPMHLSTLGEDIFENDLPEDGEVPNLILEALDALNEEIGKYDRPVGWKPSDCAVNLNQQPPEETMTKEDKKQLIYNCRKVLHAEKPGSKTWSRMRENLDILEKSKK